VAAIFVVEYKYLDIAVDDDDADIVIAAAVVDDDVALIIYRWRAHDNDVIITENCGIIIIPSFYFFRPVSAQIPIDQGLVLLVHYYRS